MASSSLLISPLSSTTATGNRELICSSRGSTFLHNSKLLFTVKPRKCAVRRSGFRSPVAQQSLDYIPKQFREENLIDGLMDNYKNVPEYLYGLKPSQIEMFMSDHGPFRQQAENVTEESLSSAYNYLNYGGMQTLARMKDHGVSKYSMNPTMYSGRGRRGRRRSPPPDLPSLLLDSRVVYLGLPIVPAVAELIVAELMWLHSYEPEYPIYLYINSSGTLNENKEIVGSETDAYAIADAMSYCKPPIYTINIGMAYGQAAMLLSLGKKGKRGMQPHAATTLHLPQVYRSSGDSTDMWIKAKELDKNSEMYLEFLEKGIGKPKEQIKEDIVLGKYFPPQEAIDYGIADRIITPRGAINEKQDNDEMTPKSRKTRKAARPSSARAAYSGPGPW